MHCIGAFWIFAEFLVSEKREEKKSFFMFPYGGSKPPPYQIKPKYTNRQNEKYMLNLVSAQTFPFPHPNPNREVHRSLTWHSSESESALKRFEPVAVAML